jgi:hypothetical protein
MVIIIMSVERNCLVKSWLRLRGFFNF